MIPGTIYPWILAFEQPPSRISHQVCTSNGNGTPGDRGKLAVGWPAGPHLGSCLLDFGRQLGCPHLGIKGGVLLCTQGRVSKALSEKCFISEFISKSFEFLLKILFNDQFAKCLSKVFQFYFLDWVIYFYLWKVERNKREKQISFPCPLTPARAHNTVLCHWPCPGNSGSQDRSGSARRLLPQFSQLRDIHSKLL